MSASVALSPSLLKSAVDVHGGGGHVPAKQAKNASMSASVAVSPSQLKSVEPQHWWTDWIAQRVLVELPQALETRQVKRLRSAMDVLLIVSVLVSTPNRDEPVPVGPLKRLTAPLPAVHQAVAQGCDGDHGRRTDARGQGRREGRGDVGLVVDHTTRFLKGELNRGWNPPPIRSLGRSPAAGGWAGWPGRCVPANGSG